MDIGEPDAKAQRRAQTAANFAARFGPRWRGVLADALGLAPQNVSRMFSETRQPGRADAPSETMLALSEALLAMPDRRLPARWRHSMSSRSRHS